METTSQNAIEAGIKIVTHELSEAISNSLVERKAGTHDNQLVVFFDVLRDLRRRLPEFVKRLIDLRIEFGNCEPEFIGRSAAQIIGNSLQQTLEGFALQLRGQDRAAAIRRVHSFLAEFSASSAIDLATVAVERNRQRQLSSVTGASPTRPPKNLEEDAAKGGEQPDPKKVFIIHGRNIEARNQLGIFVRSLGLIPVYFEDVRAGMHGTPHVSEIVEAGMAESQGILALFTPDEYASLQPQYRRQGDRPEDLARWQARPNVLFEAGMAFGKNRKRVILVVFGNAVLFSDVGGVDISRPKNDPTGDRANLRSTLAQGMGCAVDLSSNAWMRDGDFESCVADQESIPCPDPFVQTSTNPFNPTTEHLSAGAARLLRRLRSDCLRFETTEFQSISFDADSDLEARAYRELQQSGYLEYDGESSWNLTDEGVSAILKLAQADDGMGELKQRVLTALRGLVPETSDGTVHGSIHELSAALGTPFGKVFEAMLLLQQEQLLSLETPGGRDGEGAFVVVFASK